MTYAEVQQALALTTSQLAYVEGVTRLEMQTWVKSGLCCGDGLAEIAANVMAGSLWPDWTRFDCECQGVSLVALMAQRPLRVDMVLSAAGELTRVSCGCRLDVAALEEAGWV